MINKLNTKRSSGFNISGKSVDVHLTPYNKDTLNYEIWLAHFVEKAKKKIWQVLEKKLVVIIFTVRVADALKKYFFFFNWRTGEFLLIKSL